MVYNFIDYNGYLRYLLAQISEGIGNKKGDAFWNDYFSRLEQIKLKTPIIYKHIIGMVFADTYRIYCYIKDFLSLSKEEEEVFEFISSVRNIEDLFEVLKNNKLSLSDLIENSVAFALKDDYEKSLCYTASDLDFAAKFNPFTYIENDSIFNEYPLESFVSQYKELLKESEQLDEKYDEENHPEENNERVEIESEIEGVVENLRCQLLIMSYNNYDGFKKMMLAMINIFYKVTKAEAISCPELLEQIDYRILKLVEENTVADIVDEFIGDDDLMYLLIDDFLSITSDQYEIDEEEIEDCFENNVRDDVKRKLMQKD